MHAQEELSFEEENDSNYDDAIIINPNTNALIISNIRNRVITSSQNSQK